MEFNYFGLSEQGKTSKYLEAKAKSRETIGIIKKNSLVSPWVLDLIEDNNDNWVRRLLADIVEESL